MNENKAVYEVGFHGREEHIQTLHSHYKTMRERNAPDISHMFDNNVIDRKIFDKEQELVNEYKKNWKQNETKEIREVKQKIEIFEGIVADQIDGGNWMGPGVEAIATHENDDVLRGIDNVLEFTELNEEGEEIPDVPKEYLGIGFDLLVHKQKEDDRLTKKLYRFAEEDIKTGKLGKLKCYDGSEISGELSVFRAVISTNGKTMEELIDLRIKKDWEALAKHPFQADIIYQITLQFQAAVNHAVKTGNRKYIEHLRGMAIQINRLHDARQEFLEAEAERVYESEDYQTMLRFYQKNLGIDI
jgi:hypothetical protein